MYECPNCNANLKFDIASQSLLCDHCGTHMDPYAFQKERDAEETQRIEDDYEITVFTCPQCGGELVSDDTTAATFCSFCGGSTILDSRISNKKRPKFIIPFKKTKEDCRKAYKKMMRRALFAPPEFKKEEYLSRFRSIYMPYWVYSAVKKGHVALETCKPVKHDHYEMDIFYLLESEMKAEYEGIAFDASENFSDALSNAISPFKWEEAQPFTPAFLSGFYADMENVDPKIYEDDVSEIMQDELCDKIGSEPICKEYQLTRYTKQKLRPDRITWQLAMFPVWFLTYRYKDRVSYTVVNGQTGKAAGSIPVDKKRYMWGSLLLAIPIILLLNLFVSMQAPEMLFLAGILAAVCAFISVEQQKQLKAKEDYIDDEGSGRYMVIGKNKRRNVKLEVRVDMIRALVIAGIIAGTIFVRRQLANTVYDSVFMVLSIAVYAAVAAADAQLLLGGGMKVSDYRVVLDKNELLRAIGKPAVGVIMAILILMLHPAAAGLYYIAAVAIMILMGWNVLEIIDWHNRVTTRPLPQFGRRGGEEDGR